ncbi:MAG: phosphotriesterase-related protein [Mycobacteriales bacterium]|jgi:phosphotriesterase-related protein
MTEVATVLGPVGSAELGQTLMHEHVFVLTPDVQQNYPAEWDEETRVADAVRRLTAVRDAGVRTIVDPTVVGLGRYIPRIQRINEQVDINIVVATGVYTYGDAPFYFRFRGPAVAEMLPEPMVDMFVRDISEGIAGTGVRAAFLKCAVDAPGLTADGERILRAVAAAHRRTGVPITVHTHPGTKRGLDVKRVLDDEGVDPRRVVLGHSGDTTDADHLSELAEAGFYLGMDRFGIDLELPFADRVGIVVELCRRGYADRLVLSQDASCYIDWIDPALIAAMPNWHYLHVHTDVLPALRGAGVTEEQIQQMLVDNPRRYFETRDAP